jgi:hypothetical protein
MPELLASQKGLCAMQLVSYLFNCKKNSQENPKDNN